MRKLTISIATILIAMALLGCGFFTSMFPTAVPEPSPLPSPLPTNPAKQLPLLNGDWHIDFTQSGGIAGTSRSLEISSSGEMTFTNTRTGEKHVTQLPAEKLAALTDLVAAASFRPASQPSGCADCFIFDLQLASGG